MKTSDNGVNFIASFERCVLTAYKNPGEKYYTIGYGHCGVDVKAGMEINKVQALAYLKRDLATAEKYVNAYVKSFVPNQNQYDALVSYCYNRGPKGLKQRRLYLTSRMQKLLILFLQVLLRKDLKDHRLNGFKLN